MNISLSPEAAQRLAAHLDGRMLRIAFTTGCGGSGYLMSYAQAANEGDTVVAVDGLQVALDDMAVSQLDGAVIECDREHDGYILEHPNAVNVAWCG